MGERVDLPSPRSCLFTARKYLSKELQSASEGAKLRIAKRLEGCLSAFCPSFLLIRFLHPSSLNFYILPLLHPFHHSQSTSPPERRAQIDLSSRLSSTILRFPSRYVFVDATMEGAVVIVVSAILLCFFICVGVIVIGHYRILQRPL